MFYHTIVSTFGYFIKKITLLLISLNYVSVRDVYEQYNARLIVNITITIFSFYIEFCVCLLSFIKFITSLLYRCKNINILYFNMNECSTFDYVFNFKVEIRIMNGIRFTRGHERFKPFEES